MSQQDKDCLLVVHRHQFLPDHYDFYQLFLNNMTTNQVKRDVHINRGFFENTNVDRFTIIHDTLHNCAAKLSLWCNAQHVINPSCMVDDRFLIMRKGDVLNLIDYVQDSIEASLLLTDTDCSDFGDVDPQLHISSNNRLRTDIVAISPKGTMFCLYDPTQRTVYGGTLKPNLKLLFRLRVPLVNDDDLLHILPDDNMTVYIVPGHGLQGYFLKPMDLRTYVCMRWTLKESFRSTISNPGSITRINDSICYVPTIHGIEDDDFITIDSYQHDVNKSQISIKKKIEKRKCINFLECIDEGKQEIESDLFLRPRKRLKSKFGSNNLSPSGVGYRSIRLIHDGNHLYCIQQPRYAASEVLRVVNVDDGTFISLGGNVSSCIASPKNILLQTSPVRSVSVGKRKRSLFE
jgi:hypothetical protein